MKARAKLLILAAVSMATFSMYSAVAVADDYNVNAVVPYATPTQAASINTPVSGAVFHDAQQTIAGSCQIANPTNVVSVWRNGVLLGSTTCAAGSYSLSVILQLGQNVLTARTANLNGIYGPDSSSISVTFEEPITAEPLPPGVEQPTSTGQSTGAINEGGLTNLQISTQTPFSVLTSDSKVVTISVVVAGGKNPYVLQINWGDGSIESVTVESPGTYEYSHTYNARRSYTVHVKARDTLGAYSEYTYAVVTSDKVTETQRSTDKDGISERSWHIAATWYYVFLAVFVLFFLLSSYWLGWHRAKHQYEQLQKKRSAKRRLAAGKKKKKSQKS